MTTQQLFCAGSDVDPTAVPGWFIVSLLSPFSAGSQGLVEADPDVPAVAALEAGINKFQPLDPHVDGGIRIVSAVFSV